MQIDPVALELDVVQLDLAVLVAPGLHGQHLGVSEDVKQSETRLVTPFLLRASAHAESRRAGHRSWFRPRPGLRLAFWCHLVTADLE
jgi:hypothetical protein